MDCPVAADPDDTGVSAALEKIVSLESRLRQAIQNSHPLSKSFERDAASADREREALLAVGCVLWGGSWLDVQQCPLFWRVAPCCLPCFEVVNIFAELHARLAPLSPNG